MIHLSSRSKMALVLCRPHSLYFQIKKFVCRCPVARLGHSQNPSDFRTVGSPAVPTNHLLYVRQII